MSTYWRRGTPINGPAISADEAADVLIQALLSGVRVEDHTSPECMFIMGYFSVVAVRHIVIDGGSDGLFEIEGSQPVSKNAP